MRVNNTKLLALVTICVMYSLFVGCTGRGIESQDAGRLPALPGKTELPVAVPYEIPSPSSLPVPDGVEADVWQQLTAELERQLVSLRGASRVGDGLLIRSASTPPSRPLSQTMLSATATELRWGYYSNGDYDQNGEVNVADLTPLAIHFQETAWPFKFVGSTIQAVIDGDGNGEINLADVTPIALNFQNNVAKYNIYRSQNPAEYPTEPDSGNGNASLIGSLALSNATGTPNALRLQFASLRPEALRDDYFWVRPVDNEDTEGIASNRLGPLSDIFTLDGHVYMAGGGIDPLPGVPVELSEDGTVIATSVTDIYGHYSFDVPNGEYTVTPTGDPYGYSPVSIDAAIANADKYLSPIYPAPVDIVHRWALDDGTAQGGFTVGDLKIDGEENIFVTGEINTSGDYRHYLLKYDMFGGLLWSKVFNLPFSISGSKLFLLPDGGMYVCGDYSTVESDFDYYHDLYIMKLDSSGSILWDFGFNYPTIESEEHPDVGISGYIDAQNNLHVSATSRDDVTFGPERYQYSLTISPAGDLLNQVHYEPGSLVHDHLSLGSFVLDPLGGRLASGQFIVDSGIVGAFLVRFNQNGAIDWLNQWGDYQVGGGGVEIGQDGFIYHSFKGHTPGDNENRGVQFARLNQNGIRDWEILCTIENVGGFSGSFVIGPQGKLWYADEETVEAGFQMKVFPYIWSLQPNDGSLRFAHQWICDGASIDDPNITEVVGMEVNSFGVVAISGGAQAGSGEWVDHQVSVVETNWEITHSDSFTTHADTLADLRDLPLSEVGDIGTIDPPPTNRVKPFIMLYRP